MSIDIIIGQGPGKYVPLFACHGFACRINPACECHHMVKQEAQQDAPIHEVATAQGYKTGGFNFDCFSTGYYYRWLDETGIAAMISAFSPDDLPSMVKVTAAMIEVCAAIMGRLESGETPTKYTADDLEFTRWLLWWLQFALQKYGDHACIEFG